MQQDRARPQQRGRRKLSPDVPKKHRANNNHAHKPFDHKDARRVRKWLRRLIGMREGCTRTFIT